MPREIPTRVAELRVPNLDYAYFLDHDRRPFGDPAAPLDPRKAWWLAEASFLAHVRDTDLTGSHLERAGFRRASHVERDGFRVFLAVDDTKVVVAFRGTVMRSLGNLVADARIKLVPSERGGRIHSGFRRALDAVWTDLASRIAKERPGRALWITGHSLGGAMAIIAASRLDDYDGLCTFGSPRVGDADFAATFADRPCWRVIHENDIVTQLPPRIVYRHVGATWRLLSTGELTTDAAMKSRIARGVAKRLPGIFRDAEGWRDVLDNWTRDNALADHAPISYCLRLWNLTESA